MKIALGTAQFGLTYGISNFGDRVPQSEVRTILSLAKRHGIDTLDTAVSYGVSEDVLGQCGVESFRVVTKLPPMPNDLNDVKTWVLSKIYGSLRRLKCDEIYGLLLHRSEDLLGPGSEELIEVLKSLKAAGIVKKIGVSIYSPDELPAVLSSAQIDVVQCPVNVIDRRMETSGWLCRLRAEGVEVHARSVFLQGLLLLRQGDRERKFSRWSDLFRRWDEELFRANTSPLAAALAYPLSISEVDRVIVGVQNSVQITAIINAVQSPPVNFDSSFMNCSDIELINPSLWSSL